MAMADQRYPRPAAPGRAQRGFSDASISLSPFVGSAPGSALGQSSDLLGLPGSTSMSFDVASVPRTFSSIGDHISRGSNNLYNTGIFLDGDCDQQQPASNNPEERWAANYAVQPGDNNITAASAIPINRFQSEPQPSWTSLRIAPPVKPTSGTGYTQQRPGQRRGPSNRFPPGPSSDLISRTNETDEGYYTNSQPDAQSVHSMGPWHFNPDRQSMYSRQTVLPSAYSQPGPGNPTSEQPEGDTQHDQINANDMVQAQYGSTSLACRREGCEYVSRTHSDFKKHAARHNKEHVCKEPGCSRTQGFATINDLERHQKSVHKIQPEHGQSREYKCFGDSCSKHEKEWPRLDNFKQHLKRMHPTENPAMLIERSNKWYERYKSPKAKPAAQAAQRLLTPTSQQATPQTMFQTGARLSEPGQWNHRGTANQGKAASISSPDRTGSNHYTHSEVSHYRTNLSEGNPSQNVSRSSIEDMHLQPIPFSCPIPECSQPFRTLELVKEHLQSQHGSQDTLAPYYRGTQSWHKSQSKQGNQSARTSGQFASGQRFPGNTAGVQSLGQPQMRNISVGYRTQTAPGSIPALPFRLEEDFESMPMTNSQDALLSSGSSDSILAQIGMMDGFLPSASQASNLGQDTSQDQNLDQRKERRTTQTSQFFTDEVTSFLKQHASKLSNGRILSAIQMTVESLQSTSSSADVDSTPAPGPAPALAEINFARTTRDGKSVYLCHWPGCKKYMLRQCELRKHYQRHTLPWACTFDTCRRGYRLFGSKNDWKRHELKQHKQQERWRCEEQECNISGRSIPATGDDACMRVFCTKEVYLDHLKDEHHIPNGHVANKLCKSQTIGARCQGQYWCGFCNKIIEANSIGLEGNAERFNHIDHHFIKEGLHIRQWKPLNGRPSPGDSALPSGHASPVESSDAGSDEVETKEDDAAEAQATQKTPDPRRTGKRLASTMASDERGPAPKAARLVGPQAKPARTHLISCCHCKIQFQSWNAACTNCNHQSCSNCSAELLREET